MNNLLLSLLIFSVVFSQETEETFPCTGTQLYLEVTNPNNVASIVYTLTPVGSTEVVYTYNSATAESNVYKFCPESQYYTLTLSSSNGDEFWPQGVYVNAYLNWNLNEREHLGRFSYNSIYMDKPTSFTLNTQYTIPYNSEWKYKYEGIPFGFMYNTDYESWDSAKRGEFPSAKTSLQAYKKAFSLEESSITDLAGFVMLLRFKYGCIVYINDNEVYRHGIEGAFPDIAYTGGDGYPETMYRQVTRPFYDHNSLTGHSNYFIEGSNTISVVIVSDSIIETAPEFDCAIRFIHKDESTSRMFDYTITSDAIEDVNNAFDLYAQSYMHSTVCQTSSVTITFNNDRREWISGIKITSGNDQYSSLPVSFELKARNGNEDWVTLKAAEDIQFVHYLRTVHFKLINDLSFNQFMITSISNRLNCANSKEWRISEIDLTTDYYHNIPDLSYPEIAFTSAKNIINPDVFPLFDGYSDFSVTPKLAHGIVLDPHTGKISCTSQTEHEAIEYTIVASKWDGEETKAFVTIGVSPCGVNSELITVEVDYRYTNQWLWPADVKNSVELYSGKGESATLYSYMEYSASGAKTMDYCLPYGIYTVRMYSRGPNGYSKGREHYSIMTDNRSFSPFTGSIGKTGVGYDEYSFSTYIPIKSSSTWDVYSNVEAVPENWNAVTFTPENWQRMSAFDTFETTTVYLRKTFDIPSLTDYHVLNIQVQYTGGIVCYFNGHKVARFNLPAEYDSTTLALEEKTNAVTSSFAIILADFDAALTGNVIAFEIHSGTAASHTLTFSATSGYGVNDCSLLTYSTPGIIRSSYQYSDDTKPFFNWNTTAYAENTSGNAFAFWGVDNLEGARFNALGIKQGSDLGDKIYAASECDVRLDGYDETNRKYVPIGHFPEEDFSVSELRTFLLANTASETDYKFVQPKPCETSSLRITEVFYEYCVAPSCAGDDEYNPVLNGYKSYASCPIGFTGYKYKLCTNGVLGDEVNKCDYNNKIAYNGDNFIPIRVDEVISYTPTTLLPIQSISAPELPDGLMIDADGTIHGSINEPLPETKVTVTYICSDISDTVDVYFMTMDENVFAISTGTTVLQGDSVMSKLDNIQSTLYDFYILDANTEYSIVNDKHVKVIPPYGLEWQYTLPEDLTYGKTGDNGEVTTATFEINKERVFTHYQFYPEVCPANTQFVFTYELEDYLNAKFFCVPTGSVQHISTNMATEVRSLTSEPINPTGFMVFDEYTLNSPASANAEADEVINNEKNEGICGMGYYYDWSASDYSSKMMMDIQLTASSTSTIVLRPSLTFNNGLKKSLVDPAKKEFLTVLKSLTATETITNYSAEAALELMEIAYYLKNGQPISLSRTHLANILAEYCTDSCTGYENIVSILQKNGVCLEGEDLETCTPIKMEGFQRPNSGDKTTKWIKDQIDADRPVFVLLSLDPQQLQHHTYFNPNPINKAAAGVMNFGGVVTGYNAENDELAYWEVMVRRHGELNNMIKVKMDITGKNFARISNYAFTLDNETE